MNAPMTMPPFQPPLQTSALTDDECWRIACARDRRFDGRFLMGVHSTGIYCRPSCPARTPRRGNVRFYATPAEAEAAGLRPCLRCQPNEVSREEAAIQAVIAELQGAGGALTLDRLGEVTGYSSTHLQKLFKRATGMTPAAYGRALRLARASDSLSAGESVTEAVYAAGYGAPSRFYAASAGRMGMAPSAWRDGGRGVTIRWAVAVTTLGPMLVAATDKGVCRLSFNEGADELARRFPAASLEPGDADFAALVAEVVAAVETPGQASRIPLDVAGTAFQERVWQELRRIPPGETRSYAEIAAAAGNPKAVRAAGSANGANSVAVLIPCHRVVRSDGSLGGYAWGAGIKRELLRREGAQTKE